MQGLTVIFYAAFNTAVPLLRIAVCQQPATVVKTEAQVFKRGGFENKKKMVVHPLSNLYGVRNPLP
jgi:hypothetical protein